MLMCLTSRVSRCLSEKQALFWVSSNTDRTVCYRHEKGCGYFPDKLPVNMSVYLTGDLVVVVVVMMVLLVT